MAQTEPRVEELLATIRRAIDRDMGELDAREAELAPPPLRGTVDEDLPHISQISHKPSSHVPTHAEEEIEALRQRVRRQRFDDPAPLSSLPVITTPLVPQAGRLTSILNGEAEAPYETPGYDEVAPEAENQVWHEPPADVTYEPAYESAPEEQGLLSPDAQYAAQASFQALSGSFIDQMGGPAQLEGLTRELLRPLLKQWLDENLPGLVEHLVRDEIARVSRRR